MADTNNAASHHEHSVDSQEVLKDAQGSDNPIPLSPQWLLTKPGENKPGIAAEDSRPGLYPGYNTRSEISKSSDNGETIHDNEKKRAVFRPSVHDTGSGRRDGWRDEVRDTGSAIRRDRWREGDKELGDRRKTDRWGDISSNRNGGEPRRVSSERWTDSTNRESNSDQRRESKWNTRWGPDDKESESRPEKWLDTNRDVEMHRDKGLNQLTNQGKEDREGENYRPWRSNTSHSQGRGDEPLHHQTQTPNKQSSPFGYGRSRGENSPTIYAGRGRASSGGNFVKSISPHHHSSSISADKVEGVLGESSPLRYSRTKLLDVYRTTNIRTVRNNLDGFIDVSPLTQEEPVEPLALSPPTSEEWVILKGIDKGEVLSSGAPQVSKDGSVGRDSKDMVHSRRNKLENLPAVIDDYKDESTDNLKGVHYSDTPSYEKYMNRYGSHMNSEVMQTTQTSHDNKVKVEAYCIPNKKSDEVSGQGRSAAHSGIPWRSHKMGEQSHVPSHDWRGLSSEVGPRTSDSGGSQLQKDRDTEWEASEGFSSNMVRSTKRQPSDVLEKKVDSGRCLPQHSPEDLSLYYKDPQGEIQGPFSGSDLIGWFEAGFFGIDLEVRPASASAGTPYSLLGDVFPQLRAKARPPPGFDAPKQSEVAERISGTKFSGPGMLHAVSNDTDILKTEPRNRHEPVSDAEKRYFESLMSGSMSSSPLEKFALSEGLQGYVGNNSVGKLTMGVETAKDLNYLLAQRLLLERQKSIPNPHLMPDSPCPISHPQNVDLISILQGTADSSAVNRGATGWSNFPVQGGMDRRQDKTDMHHDQHFHPQAAYGIQQERLQSLNQASFANTISQSATHPSSLSTTETLLSSVLSQDPQMLNILQEQYLLSQLQLHPQAPVSTPLSMLDKLLLLKQQQNHEQQQQLLRQQQQQQHLLSQVLSDHQSYRNFSEPSYGHLQVAIPPGSGPFDHLGPRSPHEIIQTNLQVPVINSQEGLTAGFTTLPSQVPKDAGYSASSDASAPRLPHQFFENISHRESWNAALPEQVGDIQQKDLLVRPEPADGYSASSNASTPRLPHQFFENTSHRESWNAALPEQVGDMGGKFSECASIAQPRNEKGETSFPEKFHDVRIPSAGVIEDPRILEEQRQSESLTVKEVGGAEGVREVKKASEKKSRKKKSSKAQSSSDQAKAVSKTTSQQPKQSEKGGTNVAGKNDVKTGCTKSGMPDVDTVASEQDRRSLQRSISSSDVAAQGKGESREVEFVPLQNTIVHSGHRAWKPAPGLKAKSLLEIQQEEQCKAQTEMSFSDVAASVNHNNSLTPLTGAISNSELQFGRDNHPDAGGTQFNLGISENALKSRSKKSHLHDLLAEEVLAKAYETFTEAPDTVSSLSPLPPTTTQVDSAVDDAEFIEAKDTRKTRKKSAKSKVVGVKAVMPAASADVSLSFPIEKGKDSRQIQQEALPALPTGPSLGDFVPWNGESSKPLPPPAWSTDSGKLPKPISLRDILKEQEQKAPSPQRTAPIPTHQKVHSSRGTHGNVPSGPLSGSSPSKAASPIKVDSLASSAQSKSRVDDDLFWGPLDQSKHEAKRSGFPSLVNSDSWGTKNTPVKGNPGGITSRQKFTGSITTNNFRSSSSAANQSSQKGRKNAVTKHSEAMDFRDWCESETVRLTGSTNDTSFLEFCLKQSTSEAKTLLIENLGSFDPDHEFIDNFLNYKELLSADVIEIAFQSRNERKASGLGGGNVNPDITGIRDSDPDMATGHEGSTKGGKKKGKKGKKVSSSVLGFNVVSNRIMKGEIQTVED